MPYECDIEVLSTDRHALGEGPYYDQNGHKLYIVDLLAGKAVCYDLAHGNKTEYRKINEQGEVSFIIPYHDDPNKFLVSVTSKTETSVAELNWLDASVKQLATFDKVKAFGQPQKSVDIFINDGKCDPRGRLWTGLMGVNQQSLEFIESTGRLLALNASNQLVDKDLDIHASNGLGWSPSGDVMYYADTGKKVIFAYDYDLDNGSIANRRVVFDFNTDYKSSLETEFPDGLDVDSDGKLWVASFSSGRILHIDPNRRALLDYIQLPVTTATSLCFGGQDLSSLYVVTANFTLTDEQKRNMPLAGAVFGVNVKSIHVKGARLNVPYRPQ